MVASFDDLVQEVAEHTKRKDKIGRIPTFIRLAEAVLDRVLRTRLNEESWHTYLDTENNTCPLPAGYLNMRTIRIIEDDRSYKLVSCPPEALKIRRCPGMPCYFSVGGCIEFDVIPDKNYYVQMKYYKKLNPLKAPTFDEDGKVIDPGTPTNNILNYYPDLYLYLTISKLHLDSRDEEPAQYYEGLANAILEQIITDTNRGSHGAAPAMIAEGATP